MHSLWRRTATKRRRSPSDDYWAKDFGIAPAGDGSIEIAKLDVRENHGYDTEANRKKPIHAPEKPLDWLEMKPTVEVAANVPSRSEAITIEVAQAMARHTVDTRLDEGATMDVAPDNLRHTGDVPSPTEVNLEITQAMAFHRRARGGSMQGWLAKRGPDVRMGWQRVWAIVLDDSLVYFRDEHCLHKKGTLVLGPAVAAHAFTNPAAHNLPNVKGYERERPYGFVIDLGPPGDLRHTVFFDASDATSLDCWLHAIAEACSPQKLKAKPKNRNNERSPSPRPENPAKRGGRPVPSSPRQTSASKR